MKREIWRMQLTISAALAAPWLWHENRLTKPLSPSTAKRLTSALKIQFPSSRMFVASSFTVNGLPNMELAYPPSHSFILTLVVSDALVRGWQAAALGLPQLTTCFSTAHS